MKYFFYLFFLLMFFCNLVYARDQLTLQFDVKFQYKVTGVDEWVTIDETKVFGIGAFQVKLNDITENRIVFTVKKPFDLKGTFKVRTPLRSDGIVAKAKSDTVQIILGPHKGCPKEEKRCQSITLDDVGNIELRLDLSKAKQTSFGVLLFRPYSQMLVLPVRPSVSYEDKSLFCGDEIETGWFIFTHDIEVQGSPDTISLCIEKPNGDKECAEDEETEIEVSASQSGEYVIVAWNTTPLQTRCKIIAD